MNSLKQFIIFALVNSVSSEQIFEMKRDTLASLRGPQEHPNVKAGNCADAGAAITRLKKGPVNIPEVVAAGVAFNDAEFTAPDSLFINGYESTSIEANYDTNLASGQYTWSDWKTKLPNSPMFNAGTVTYTEPNQGGLGTCYHVAAIAAAAEYPSLITDVFLTGTDDSPIGLYGLRFYIRGHPWVVTTDSKFIFSGSSLKYMQIADNGAMWAPMMEKVWGKIKGAYYQTAGGFTSNGLRSVTGAPTIRYEFTNAWTSYTTSAADTHALIKAADTAGYIMTAGTGGGADTTTNDCGIANSHAYSIITAFDMTAADNTVYNMVMLRNPWGVTYYNGAWNKDDSAWTSSMISQVPFGINPTTSNTDGIFFMSKELFQQTEVSGSAYSCLTNFEVAHYRASEGYKNSYFDIMGDDGTYKNYKTTIPANDGDLYFTAETYYREMVPSECMTSIWPPQIYFELYKQGVYSRIAYQWYDDQFSRFILVGASSYSSGNIYRFGVQMKEWRDFPSAHRDITVAIYSKQTLEIKDASGNNYQEHYNGSQPSGFTESTYRGMNPCEVREFKDINDVCSECADYTYTSTDERSCVFDTCTDVQKLKEDGTCEDCQPFNRADETGKVCRPDTCDDSVQILIEDGTCSTCQTFTHPDDDKRVCISDTCTATQILIEDGTCHQCENFERADETGRICGQEPTPQPEPTPEPTPEEPTPEESTTEEPVLESLEDVFIASYKDGFILGGFKLLGLCFGEAASVCFNPFNWF